MIHLPASAPRAEHETDTRQGIWREDSTPGSPQGNMDTDTQLFEAVRDGMTPCPVVRVYTWDRPSVSLGKMQDAALVQAEFPGLPWVRRPTGGLAVRHGNDLTIAVITRGERLPRSEERGVLASYRQIMEGLLWALGAVGVDARLGGSACARLRGSTDCFASVADCDATEALTGRKLIGSAQRREGGAILQQMSIPRGSIPNTAEFIAHARTGLAEALGVGQWQLVDTAAPV